TSSCAALVSAPSSPVRSQAHRYQASPRRGSPRRGPPRARPTASKALPGSCRTPYPEPVRRSSNCRAVDVVAGRRCPWQTPSAVAGVAANQFPHLTERLVHLGLELPARHQAELVRVELRLAQLHAGLPGARSDDRVAGPVDLHRVVAAAEPASGEGTPHGVDPLDI